MNLEHYAKNTRSDFKVLKYVFSEGSYPLVTYTNGTTETLSSVLLTREDLVEISKDLNLEIKASTHQSFHAYKLGQKLHCDILNLKDRMRFEVRPFYEDELSLDFYEAPGFMKDLAQAKEGVLIFYGPDKSMIRKIQMSLCQRRASKVSGSSLCFTDYEMDFTGLPEHSIVFSKNDLEFLKSGSSMSFSTLSFERDFIDLDARSVLKQVSQSALVLLNSPWQSLQQAWLDYGNWPNESFKRYAMDQALGFIGVRTVLSASSGLIPFFEVLPFDLKVYFEGDVHLQLPKLEELTKRNGVTFNQSLMSHVLKRKVKLEEAYKVSPNPEELNAMLTQAGM